MKAIQANRASDARLLEWVKLRAAGVSCTVIGETYGVSRQLVHMYTRDVRAEDIKHCGPEVSRHYW